MCKVRLISLCEHILDKMGRQSRIENNIKRGEQGDTRTQIQRIKLLEKVTKKQEAAREEEARKREQGGKGGKRTWSSPSVPRVELRVSPCGYTLYLSPVEVVTQGCMPPSPKVCVCGGGGMLPHFSEQSCVV